MKALARAKTTLKRKIGSTLILLALILLLGTLVSAAVSVLFAVERTHHNLRSQLPAIATIRLDESSILEQELLTGIMPEFSHVTAPLIKEIGNLTYVRMFDYTAWGYRFFSHDLRRTFDPNWFLLVEHTGTMQEQIDLGSLVETVGLDFDQFLLKGVQLPYIADIEAGLIELVSGRTFTENEIYNVYPVALVSQQFLNSNNLMLGDSMRFYYKIFEERPGLMIPEFHFSDDNLLARRGVDLDIIGVFDYQLPSGEGINFWNIESYINMVNRIYVPNAFIESMLSLYLEAFENLDSELFEMLSAVEDVSDMIYYENILFLLNCPSELDSFSTAASNILPDFWIPSYLSSAYAEISNSMLMINDLAIQVLVGTVIAAICLITLLLLIFIKDRQNELGIYLVLGEKKGTILKQLIYEVLFVSVIAIFFAIFIGNVMAEQISTSMIQRDLIQQADQEGSNLISNRMLEGMGFRFEMTHEQMLASYDVSMDVQAVLIFISVSVGVIILALVLPSIYILKMKPRSLISKGSIG